MLHCGGALYSELCQVTSRGHWQTGVPVYCKSARLSGAWCVDVAAAVCFQARLNEGCMLELLTTVALGVLMLRLRLVFKQGSTKVACWNC